MAALYEQHALRTVREADDHARLYGMPGTRGLVAEAGGELRAYAFCGKGADFPDYVAEWGGSPGEVLAVLQAVREAGLASRVLVPAGGEELLAVAMPRGAQVAVVPSGLWSVLRPEALAIGEAGVPGGDRRDPTVWLGAPGADGLPRPGLLQVAVWGFDSV